MNAQCKRVFGTEYEVDFANGAQNMRVFWESDPILCSVELR